MTRGVARVVGPSLLVVSLFFAAGCERFEKKPEAPPPPPPEVLVVEVATREVPISSEWVGTTDGLVDASVRAKVQGYIVRQAYPDGGFVKKGDLLFEIDPRPFEAALDQAKGMLAQAEGVLGQAQAFLGKADIDVTRYRPLAAANAISQQDLDNAIQAQIGARAAVSAAQASIEAAKAQVVNAELNLEFTKIVSPVDGIAAIATTQVGDLVGPSTGTLTTVSTVDPIRVFFPISEQEYLKAADRLGGKSADQSKAVLQLVLSDGSIYGQTGRVSAADSEVDLKTGTIKIVGLFPNPKNLLRPGQYARVRTVTQLLPNAVVIPQRAVTEVQGSFQVWLVDDDGKLVVRGVQLGQRINASEVIVTQGLEAGETIVVEGLQKGRPGMKVTTKPWSPTPTAAKSKKGKSAQPATTGASDGSHEPAPKGTGGDAHTGDAAQTPGKSGRLDTEEMPGAAG